MKQLFILLIAIFGAVSVAHSAVGDKFTADGIEYVITSESPAEVAVGANAGYTASSVDIPASVVNGATTYAVTAVGTSNDRAFANLSSLTSVKLSTSIKVINGHAFRETNITSIVIPNSVERISGFAFYGCSQLARVEMGTGVNMLDVYAFHDCPLLKDVICLAVTPPVTNGGFSGSTPITSATLHVPSGSVTAYQGANTWKDFGTIKAYVPTSLGSLRESGISLISRADGIQLTTSAPVAVSVFTLSGAKVYDRTLIVGTHAVTLPQGVYIVKAGTFAEKIVVR